MVGDGYEWENNDKFVNEGDEKKSGYMYKRRKWCVGEKNECE